MSIADQKILAWIMKGPVEYNKVSRDIDAKILGEALGYDYRSTYNIIETYYKRYKTPPSFKILEDNLAEDIDTVQLVSILKDESCDESEILFYIDQVRDRFNSELAIKFSESISHVDVDLEEFNSNLTSTMAKIDRLRRKSVFAEGDICKSVDERKSSYLFTEENPDIVSGVLSGYPALDDYIYGIKPSELMIISGASSSGKSLLMMNIAVNAWLGSNKPSEEIDEIADDGKNIIYVTLEMSKAQLEQRIDANLAAVRHKAIMRGFLTDAEKVRWNNSLDFQKRYNKKF